MRYKNPVSRPPDSNPTLARRIGLFDATMLVMGGIIGSGIFMNPSVVALQVHTPFLLLSAWTIGGLFALTAGFIWAELAALRPDVGGQYAYLREAFHFSREDQTRTFAPEILCRKAHSGSPRLNRVPYVVGYNRPL